MPLDLAAQAFTRAGILLVGVPVIFQRITGYAPSATILAAAVTAKIETVTPDTTAPSQQGLTSAKPGAIEQDSRFIIVMAADLVAAGFTLPIVKGDRISVPSTGEFLTINRIDPYRRAFSGAIEMYASAVA